MRLAAALLPLSMALPARANPPAQPPGPQPPLEQQATHWMDGSCSYTTAMFERRILADGDSYTFTGHLTPAKEPLDNHVAAPFHLGEDDASRVLANLLIEEHLSPIESGVRVELTGKRLLIGDVAYFTATQVTVMNDGD